MGQEYDICRAREGMKDLIDYVACIHLPMDIALARRLLRNLRHGFGHWPFDEKVSFLESSLEEYLNGGRIAYQKIFEFGKICKVEAILQKRMALNLAVIDSTENRLISKNTDHDYSTSITFTVSPSINTGW